MSSNGCGVERGGDTNNAGANEGELDLRRPSNAFRCVKRWWQGICGMSAMAPWWGYGVLLGGSGSGASVGRRQWQGCRRHGMKASADMRCQRMQGGVASKKTTINRDWREEDDGDHGVNKAQRMTEWAEDTIT